MKVTKRHLTTAVRVLLGGVFVYASISKIADPVTFAGSVAAYRILPYFASYLVAAVLPWLELFCGLLLILGTRVRGSAVIVGALNLVFIAALASAIARGLDIDCGCFRHVGKSSPWTALLRDLVLLAMTAAVLKGEAKKEKGHLS